MANSYGVNHWSFRLSGVLHSKMPNPHGINHRSLQLSGVVRSTMPNSHGVYHRNLRLSGVVRSTMPNPHGVYHWNLRLSGIVRSTCPIRMGLIIGALGWVGLYTQHAQSVWGKSLEFWVELDCTHDMPKSNGNCSFDTSPDKGTSTIKRLIQYSFQFQLYVSMVEFVTHDLFFSVLLH